MVLNNDMLSKNISLENPSVAFSGDAKFLVRLWVSKKADEISQSDSSQSATTSCYPHKKKIIAALKQLTFREQRVIVQFWSPAHVVGKHQVLTTIDQPYGLGAITEELNSYRKDSERNSYVVDKDHEEEELSPPARVFRRQLPEWTSDVANYSLKQFPQKDSASRCNLHGYLALPVLDTLTRSCIGVLELLTYSKYHSFAYEVRQFEKALKTQDLTCLKRSDGPSNVPFESGKNELDLDDIFSIMKVVCDTQNIPLAQTWAMSPLNTFSSHEQTLRKRCDSFDTKCLGKVCMSTAALPYYVKDLGLWPFRQACRKQHLDKSHSPVGRALLSGGSCFCGDVTKLSEEEYPLVHFARLHGLTSSFAINLHSVESNEDYVLEFFLPFHMKDIKHVFNLVQLLKQYFEVASRFELGDKSFIEVFGPPMDLCVNIEPDIMDTFSDVPDIASTDFVDVPDECLSTSVGRKRKRGSKNMVYVKATYGEDSKGFWFPISSGLSKLKKEVAKWFKLKSRMIRLKYWDEDDDLITFSSNDDLRFAKIASGSKNRINLICESASYRID